MTNRGKPTLLRRLNERAVFELVRSRGSLSRPELTRSIGISPPTVSRAVAKLLRAGFLDEMGSGPTNGSGRPGKVYRLGAKSVQVLGAGIDVRHCYVLATGLDARVDETKVLEFPTPPTYDLLIDALAEHAQRLMQNGRIQTLGMGISVPGQIDVRSQRVLLSPNLHMTDGKSPTLDLGERLGVETIMIHETTAACLAEHAYGAAQGLNDFALIGTYEGFGVSIISGGRLLQGHEMMAGEVGHITIDRNGERCGCGNRGCLETVATDTSFARAVSRRLGRKVEIEEVVRLAREEQLDVAPELDETLDYLAIGIAAVINIFNPEAVSIDSRMLKINEQVFEQLKTKVAQRALRPLMRSCRILRSETNSHLGAIAGVIHHLTRSLGPVID